MPGGREASGGREPTKPPWVRETGSGDAENPTRPPKWPLRKRSQPQTELDANASQVNSVEEQLANVKASLKKQNIAKPKPENGVVDDDDDKVAIIKPSAVKKTESEKSTPVKKNFTEKKANKEPPKEEAPAKKPPLPKQPSRDELAKKPPVLLRQSSKEDTSVKKWRDPLLEKKKDNIDRTLSEIPKGHTLTKNESLRSLLKPVPPPMPPPMPPKLPPPPEFKKSPATTEKIKRIETLRSRPRKRPDWSDMMKEVESGKKLKHVVCNDRSSPIITKSNMVKAKGQYVYESEKGNMHNQLLKQINQGVKLKTVKTNDRSRPNLEGLRKIRRQITVEEQIQKSISQANLAEGKEACVSNASKEAPPEEDEIDEMDDIDKVRDDLQSTKQLLALELRNKEAMQRENKRLLARITNLEAELKSERAHVKQEQAKTVISVVDAYDDTLISSLKKEVTETKRVADDLEKKYHKTAEELDETISELEESRRKNAELEKKLEQAMKGTDSPTENEGFYQIWNNFNSTRNTDMGDQGIMPNSNQNSRRSSHVQKQQSVQKSSSEEEIEDSSSDTGLNEEEIANKRLQKEIKMLGNKVRNLNEKKDKAHKERAALRVQLKNQQAVLKTEKKKYKALKKEVDKMATLMKENDSEEENSEEADESPENEEAGSAEEEEESESESEEEESESEDEEDEEKEPEDASLEQQKGFITSKVKRLETSLSALKKGNYLMIANVDRLKDEINKQREMSANLQEDLDSVLAELE